MNSKIKQHEEQYWHIPKIALLPILGFIIFTLLAYGNLQLIDKAVLSEIFKQCPEIGDCISNLNPGDLINLYPIIGEYILISLALISLIASFKKGYKNLNSYDEEGLILGLIAGLIGGSIFGLIAGLIGGSIFGLIFSLRGEFD